MGWASLPVPIGAIQVSQRLSTTNATVGDKVIYTLTITYPKSGVLLPLPETGLPEDIAIVRFKKEKKIQSGKVTDQFTAELVPFGVGRFVMPTRSVAARVNGKVQTVKLGSLSISVRSILSQSNRQLADLKRVKSPSVPIGIWLVVALAGVGVGGIMLRLKTRLAPAPNGEGSTDLISPYPQLLVRLSESANDSAAISYTLRSFLAYRFGCNALGLTTREVLGALNSHLPESDLADVAAVLQLCDQVKFAQYRATPIESRAAYESAMRFLKAYPDPIAEDGQ